MDVMAESLNESCWLWTRGRFENGYGQAWKHGPRTKPSGRYGQPIQAHRLIYEILVGPIPPGMQLDHLCRQRGCVNPNHLRVVTSRENILAPGSTCEAKTNHEKVSCPKGHLYTAENTYTHRGKRSCRECKREQKRTSALGKSVRPRPLLLEDTQAAELTGTAPEYIVH